MKTLGKILFSAIIGLFVLQSTPLQAKKNVEFKQLFRQTHKTTGEGSRQGAAIFDK